MELGLGVEQLAGRMGVDARQVRRIERGEANLTFDTLTGLATGLDRRPSDLLAAVERAFALADLEATTLSDETSDEPAAPSSQRGSPTRDGSGAPLHRFVGNAVARLRRMAQLTQRELAEMAGVSLSAVQSVESGRHAPTTMTLETLARALRCEVSDLVGPAHLEPRKAQARV